MNSTTSPAANVPGDLADSIKHLLQQPRLDAMAQHARFNDHIQQQIGRLMLQIRRHRNTINERSMLTMMIIRLPVLAALSAPAWMFRI